MTASSTGTTYQCRVVGVNYHGGIIGLFIDEKKKLEGVIQQWNDQGYRLREVLPAKLTILSFFFRVILLIVTLLLWTWEPGETLIFERRHPPADS